MFSLAGRNTLPDALFGVYTMARRVNDFLPEDDDLTDEFDDDDDDDEEGDEDSDFEEEEDD